MSAADSRSSPGLAPFSRCLHWWRGLRSGLAQCCLWHDTADRQWGPGTGLASPRHLPGSPVGVEQEPGQPSQEWERNCTVLLAFCKWLSHCWRHLGVKDAGWNSRLIGSAFYSICWGNAQTWGYWGWRSSEIEQTLFNTQREGEWNRTLPITWIHLCCETVNLKSCFLGTERPFQSGSPCFLRAELPRRFLDGVLVRFIVPFNFL